MAPRVDYYVLSFSMKITIISLADTLIVYRTLSFLGVISSSTTVNNSSCPARTDINSMFGGCVDVLMHERI